MKLGLKMVHVFLEVAVFLGITLATDMFVGEVK
jgi:hypothetical protein